MRASQSAGGSWLGQRPICMATLLLVPVANNQHLDADCRLAEQIAAMYGIDVASIEIPDAEHVMFLSPAKIIQQCPIIARRAVEPRLLVSFHPRRKSEHPCSLPDMYSRKWAGWMDTTVRTIATQRKTAVERARLMTLSLRGMCAELQDERLQVSVSASIEPGNASYSWVPMGWVDGATVVVLQQALIAVLTGLLLLRHVPGGRQRSNGATDPPDGMMLATLFDRYDVDHDGYLNALEYTLLLHDIGVNVNMTPDRWAAERKQLQAPDGGIRMEHLKVFYSDPKYRLGKLEVDYALVRELPAWPGRGGWVSDHYRLGKVLGAGEKGRVHVAAPVAAKTSSETQVAVKILSKRALGLRSQNAKKRHQSCHKCFREIDLLTSVGCHPNIAQIKGAYQCVEEIAVVMSFATGGEVYAVLAQRGSYSEAEVRSVIHSVGSALAHCHSHGIVHRDVKPANVLYADHTHKLIQLVDFGCAGRLTTSTRSKLVSSTASKRKPSGRQRGNTRDPLYAGGHNNTLPVTLNKLTGTTVYMAPEFFIDRVDAKTQARQLCYSCAKEDCSCTERDAAIASILAQSTAAFACSFVTILLLLASASHLGCFNTLGASSGFLDAATANPVGFWEAPSPLQCCSVGVVVSVVGFTVYCQPLRVARACRCKCLRRCANVHTLHRLTDIIQASDDNNPSHKATSIRSRSTEDPAAAAPAAAAASDDEGDGGGGDDDGHDDDNHAICGVDIWALGVLAYELLFGDVPFDAPSEAELEALIVLGTDIRAARNLGRYRQN